MDACRYDDAFAFLVTLDRLKIRTRPPGSRSLMVYIATKTDISAAYVTLGYLATERSNRAKNAHVKIGRVTLGGLHGRLINVQI